MVSAVEKNKAEWRSRMDRKGMARGWLAGHPVAIPNTSPALVSPEADKQR